MKPLYRYVPPPELRGEKGRRWPVAIAGAGPVGLAAAIDLELQGIPVVVLEEDDSVGAGSRAICWAKRTLEIFDRLGAADKVVAKGVTWNRGKVFFRDRQIYGFDLLPAGGNKYPAFVNLQQYFVEEFLVERAAQVGADLRWKNRVVALEAGDEAVRLRIETPSGGYGLECEYLIAADGVRSAVRELMSLESTGQTFNDRFLIADVKMKAPFPAERWFWFDPPFHPGQSALLHRQADDVWRIDLQLGADADPEAERRPERVLPRIRAMLGATIDFELEWVSVYTFKCRRLDRFRHGRVIFAGDSAHQMSPFGARGGNGGIQDADNLCWKLALVLRGLAPASLLDSYDAERGPAADENILNSTRSTDFITPKGEISHAFRDATLALAEHFPFARRLVNSGRLSIPHAAANSPLSTPDAGGFAVAPTPGSPCADAPAVRDGKRGWLLEALRQGFSGLYFAAAGGGVPPAVARAFEELGVAPVPVRCLVIGPSARGRSAIDRVEDPEGLVSARYDAGPGTFYLIRPDQHVAARWRDFSPGEVSQAVAKAIGNTTEAS
jgi:3-(3-hydroxy-phenyl)propionate hydroxylase